MAHYAFLDENNIVTEVIVGRDEDDLVDGITSWEEYYGGIRGQKCVQTSYNTRAGIHINGGKPFRGNFAGIGMKYDEELDAFVDVTGPKGWIFNADNFSWEPPFEKPSDDKRYIWNEEAQNWEPVEKVS